MQKKKYDSPMDAALSYLTARMRTRAETEDKLKQLGYSREEIGATVERLEELRLIDDPAYAAEYVRTRTATGNFSRAALKAQLTKHKLGNDLIAETVETIDQEQEYAACKAAAQREWRIKKALPVKERKQKVFAKLCRSGFEMDAVISICRELAAGEEEELDL